MTNVLVIAGFLMSGKSTFINQLLPALEGDVKVVSLEQGIVPLEGDPIYVEDLEELRTELKRLAEENTDTVVLEFNGTIPLGDVYVATKDLPLVIRRFVYLLDEGTAEMFLSNMTTLMLEQINYVDELLITKAGDEDIIPENILETLRTLNPSMKIHKNNASALEALTKVKSSSHSQAATWFGVILTIVIFGLLYHYLLR